MLQDALKAVGIDVGISDGDCGTKGDAGIREYQKQEFGNADGEVGRITWTRLLQDAAVAGWLPPLERRIHAVIAYYENSTRQNAYGATSLLSDGAGVNYGVLQHNRHGSLYRVLQMGGRQDLADRYQASDKFKRDSEIAYWMQSPSGVAAQNRYFDKTILRLARKTADQMPTVRDFFAKKGLEPYWGRFLLMLADTMTQNGALWSPHAKPFWRTITPGEAQHAKYRELHAGTRFDALEIKTDACMYPALTYVDWKKEWYKVEALVKAELGDGASSKDVRRQTNKRAMIEMVERVPMAVQKLVVIGQWRARSSSAKWWTPAVESRRMLDSAGVGVVNGAPLNLEDDFGFIDDDLFGLQNPYEGDDE
jgi:hypothetical protein